MAEHLYLSVLLILHYLYYSVPRVYVGNGNLIKRLLKSMEILLFIGLPWAQLTKVPDSTSTFSTANRAQHLLQGAPHQQVRARLLLQVHTEEGAHRGKLLLPIYTYLCCNIKTFDSR